MANALRAKYKLSFPSAPMLMEVKPHGPLQAGERHMHPADPTPTTPLQVHFLKLLFQCAYPLEQK